MRDLHGRPAPAQTQRRSPYQRNYESYSTPNQRRGAQLSHATANPNPSISLPPLQVPNPFQKTDGEQLPPGMVRNYNGFLIRELTPILDYNRRAVSEESVWLKEHLVISSFIGRKIPQHQVADWLVEINSRLGHQAVTLRMDMGRGFLFLETPSKEATSRLIALSPFVSKHGTAIFQEWVEAFDPDNPVGLRIPTWISFVKLPFEFRPLTVFLASCLGTVYATDPSNHAHRDPRVCIGLDVRQGRPGAIELSSPDHSRRTTVLVNYEHAPIRCRFCLSLFHKIVDCPARENPANSQTFSSGAQEAVEELWPNVEGTTHGHRLEYSLAQNESHPQHTGQDGGFRTMHHKHQPRNQSKRNKERQPSRQENRFQPLQGYPENFEVNNAAFLVDSQPQDGQHLGAKDAEGSQPQPQLLPGDSQFPSYIPDTERMAWSPGPNGRHSGQKRFVPPQHLSPDRSAQRSLIQSLPDQTEPAMALGHGPMLHPACINYCSNPSVPVRGNDKSS